MDSPPRHVHVHRQCGACGWLCRLGDRVVALFEQGAAIYTQPVNFPDFEQHVDRDGLRFCRHFDCPCRIGEVPEPTDYGPREFQGLSVTVHQDCFNLYRRWANCADPVHRLYRLSIMRNPWPGCVPPLLEPEPDSSRAAHTLAAYMQSCGMPFLPLEIVSLIAEHLGESGILLRFTEVLETVNIASKPGFDHQVLIPPPKLQSWRRGGQPVMRTDSSPSSVEVTIDARGIQSIERLRDLRERPRSPWASYALLRVYRYHVYSVCLQHGGANLPGISAAEQLFDTSGFVLLNSTRYRDFHPGLGRHNDAWRVATIDLASCTGITIFMGVRDTLAVHTHSLAGPSADVTFSRIEDSLQAEATWLYVPISAADEVEAFGLRACAAQSRHILAYLVSQARCDTECDMRMVVKLTEGQKLRTRLGGSVVIGQQRKVSYFTDQAMCTTPSSSYMAWSVDKSATTYTLEGVTDSPKVYSGLWPIYDQPPVPVEKPFCSRARLHDISTVWIFRDKDTRYLRGLVLRYNNGGERAVGTCRTGLDPVEKCADLSRLQFLSRQIPTSPKLSPAPVRRRPLNVVQVKQSDVLEAGWTRCPSDGHIEAWFNRHEMVVAFTHGRGEDKKVQVLRAVPLPWEGLGSLGSWSVELFA